MIFYKTLTSNKRKLDMHICILGDGSLYTSDNWNNVSFTKIGKVGLDGTVTVVPTIGTYAVEDAWPEFCKHYGV